MRFPSILLFVALVGACGCKGQPPEPTAPRVTIDPETTRAATEAAAEAVIDVPAGDVSPLAGRVREVYEAFQAGSPDALNDCRALGRDALTAGDLDATAAVCALLIEAGQAEETLTYLDEADIRFKGGVGRKTMLFARSQAELAMGRPEVAATTFAKALEIEPVNPFEYAGAADLWLAAGKPGEAAAVLDEGLEEFAADPILITARAEADLRGGDAAGALQRLDTLLASQPDEVGAHIVRIEALLVLGRAEEARDAAAAFERDFTMLSHGTVFLGLAEARLGNDDVAEAAWVRAAVAIEQCVVCAGDEADLLEWARVQAGEESVAPQAQ